MSDQRFPSWLRLRKPIDFQRAYARGAHAADAVLVLRGCPNDLPYARLGVSVSRKVGKAVRRNHWKRLFREVFRQHRDEIPAGYDYVARPRKGASPDYHAIGRSLPSLCQRLVRRLEAERP